jgi:hypothetical protein
MVREIDHIQSQCALLINYFAACTMHFQRSQSEPSTDSTRRYPLTTFTYSAFDEAYTLFRQDHFGLPEDGAPEAPKHLGTS